MSNTVNFTVEQFLLDFPEFQGTDLNILQIFNTRTKCYISTENYGVIHDESRLLACELMMAHLLTIYKRITDDNQTQAVAVASASIQNVTVSLTPPSNRTQFEFWLNLSIYGTQLWSLLTAKTPVGFYIPGLPQRVLW